jgi:hypothetical protein
MDLPSSVALYVNESLATHGLSSVEWTQREQFQPWQTKISETNSWYVQRKLYLPPINIKLGMMRNFDSAMGHNGKEFQYLLQKFPQVSESKIK